MALRLMSGIPARIAQVLKDFLPAELDLIDAEEADGITTPDVGNDAYHEWDQQFITESPACTIRTVSTTPIEVRPDTFGQRIHALHRLDVMFHATLKDSNQDSLTLQKLMHRYVNAAARVLCLTKEALQTSADNTRWLGDNGMVSWIESASYGPEVEQENGAVVRTATLPLTIRRVEARV